MAILSITVLIALLGVFSGSEAVTDSALPPAVFLNEQPGLLLVKKPEPVNLPTFILGGQWADKPFELYVFTGSGSGSYLGNDYLWHSYDTQNQMYPVIATGMPNYQGVNLPQFANLYWTAFADSTGLPDGDMPLTVCIDNKLDGMLLTADSTCGTVTVRLERPTCLLSLSKKDLVNTITEGTNAQQETITVSDTCNSNSFTASVETGGAWLAQPQIAGNAMTVFYNASGLPASTLPYTGTILVTSAGGATDTITTSLTVTPKATCTKLTASPVQVKFTGTVAPIFGTVTVTNSPQQVTVKDCSGNNPANLALAVDDASKQWLSTTRNADGTVAVSANGKAGAGTHYGTVTVSASGFTPLTIPVSITAGGGSTCNASTVNIYPTQLPFSGVAGSTSSESVTVRDGCNNGKSFSVSASKSWIGLSPTSGTGGFTVTVTMPQVADSGTISVTVGGIKYTIYVSATPTGPPVVCNASKVQLVDQSRQPLQMLNVTGTPTGAATQLIGVEDDCHAGFTTYSYSVYELANGAACTPPPASPAAPSWMTVSKSAASSQMSVGFSQPNLGTYKACIAVTPTNSPTAFAPVYLPVTLTVATAPPQNVTVLKNGVVTPIESLKPLTGKVYSAQQTGSFGGFTTATKDWSTQCDMIVMYSGTVCGEKLPDVNDYNAIIDDIRRTGQEAAKGKVFNNFPFYYQIVGQNQTLSLSNIPLGCYYVYVHNRSDIAGTYVLTWMQR